ncbi:sensor domain-containing diguanylate cyclase [Thalassotalea sp. PLHSN55]|uniref:sensor domain-containing diguanylate cyclase n=1 Tax=Thalassotalea sp. PLHSN55 TaxID=3435888 RepID=UPI003F82EB82
MTRFVQQLVVILLALVSCFAVADDHYAVSTSLLSQDIQDYRFLADENLKQLSDEEIINLPRSSWAIQSYDGETARLSRGKNWLHFSIDNQQPIAQTVYLSVKKNRYLTEHRLLQHTGQVNQFLPFSRDENNRLVKKLYLPANSSSDIYLYFSTPIELYLPIELMSEQAYISKNNELAYLKGAAIGGYVFLTASFLLLFIASTRKSVLYLSGYFCIRTLMLMVLLGKAGWWVLAEYPWVEALKIPVLTSLSILFLLWFCVELFALNKKFPALAKQVKLTSVVLIVYIPVGAFFDETTNFVVSLLLHNFTTLLLVVTGWQLMKKAVPLALIFTVIMAVQFIVGIFIDVAIIWQSLQLFNNSELFFSVSFWLNGLLFIFLVSRLMYLQVKARQKAQIEALNSAMETKQAQEELLQLQQETQEQLEDRVQERTLELNIAFQELENLNKELAQKSTTDDLTGLYNRRHYDQKILAEFRRSHRNLTPLSLVLIDIDHFKQVNDTYGHIAGDECLVWIANRMKACLRRSADLSFRYGGEEFCFILPETDVDGARSLAEELCRRVRKEAVQHQGKEIQLTVSCGITTYQQQDNIELQDLFYCADKALYRAKELGRDQVQIENLISSQE